MSCVSLGCMSPGSILTYCMMTGLAISWNRQSFLEINIELRFETTPWEELILVFCADRGAPGRVVLSLALVHFEELIEWSVGAGGGSSRVCMNILGVKRVPRSLDAVKRSLWQLMGLTADRWLCEREGGGWREGERGHQCHLTCTVYLNFHPQTVIQETQQLTQSRCTYTLMHIDSVCVFVCVWHVRKNWVNAHKKKSTKIIFSKRLFHSLFVHFIQSALLEEGLPPCDRLAFTIMEDKMECTN